MDVLAIVRQYIDALEPSWGCFPLWSELRGRLQFGGDLDIEILAAIESLHHQVFDRDADEFYGNIFPLWVGFVDDLLRADKQAMLPELWQAIEATIEKINARLSENDARMQLNQVLAYHSLIRDPSTQKLHDIDIRYYLNAVDLDGVIAQCITSIRYPDLPLGFRDVLEDSQLFTQWLLDCHRVMCLGLQGNRHYGGCSTSLAGTDDGSVLGMVGRLRGAGDRIFLRLSSATDLHYPFQYAQRYGERLAQADADAERFYNHFLKQNKAFFYLTEGIQTPDREALTRYIQSGELWTQSGDPLSQFSGDLLIANPQEGNLCYFYPGAAYVPDYLDLMRRSLRDFFFCDDDRRWSQGGRDLARFYQAGCRCQAFCTTWNSILMAIINRILVQAGYGRMPHLFFDYCALLFFSFDHFSDLFTGFLTGRYGLQWHNGTLVRNERVARV